MLNDEKYNRNISLLCPTCGGSHFEYETGVDETIEVAKCASCGRSITKDELLRENSENIHEHVSEMAEQVKNDLAKELQESLKKAFSGNKNIRIT